MKISAVQQKQIYISRDFWLSFRTLPLAFDEYAFDHWYLFIIGAACIYLTIDFSNVRKNITNSLLISLGFILVLTALAFNKWRRLALETFHTLQAKDLLSSNHPNGNTQESYLAFLEAYQFALLSKKRFFIIGISILTMVALIFWAEFHDLFPNSSHISLIIQIGEALVKVVIPVSLMGYFFGVAAWAMITAGRFVQALASQFTILIQPSHPDKCGGLRFLGSFCLGMALPLLIGISYLALYSIQGTLHPIWEDGLNLVQLASGIGLLIFAVPLSAITFFGPLWSIHLKMMQKKEIYEDEFTAKIAKLEQQMQAALDQNNIEEAKAKKEAREILLVLHPDNLDYPDWPFDKRILLTFIVPQILPFISIVVSLIKP